MAMLQLCCLVSALLAVTMADVSLCNNDLYGRFINKDPNCRKVKVDDHTYRHILLVPGGSVYCWSAQVCPYEQTFNEETCECNRLGDAGQTASVRSCNVVADIGRSAETGQFNSSTYVRLSSQERGADLLNLTSNDGLSLNLQRDDPLLVQSFHGNDLVAPWESSMTVKPVDINAATVLMCDECGTESGEQKSVELVLNQGFLSVYFRFTNDTFEGNCPVFADGYGEYKVDMTSEGTEVRVAVNGAPCITVDKKAKLAMTDCGMYVGARYAPEPNPYSQVVSAQLKEFKFTKNPASC